ncbi:MAG: hypothetical protein KGM15_12110 [Pseudomonadota bacterium]|nr:hypothetical protein [Pseudomonadota bacterium]
MTRLVEQDGNRVVEEDNIVPPPPYRGEGRPQIITADTARQAPLGKRVLYVLLVALALVGMGLLAAWVFAGAPAVR